VGGLAERDPIRPAADGWAPAATALSGGAPDWKTSSSPGSRQRDSCNVAAPTGDRGGTLARRSHSRQPGLGRVGRSWQRAGRMAPLRWGTRAHLGAVSGEDARPDVHDAFHRSASRGGIYLDTAETAGSPKKRAKHEPTGGRGSA
jgi:hypothetical protein